MAEPLEVVNAAAVSRPLRALRTILNTPPVVPLLPSNTLNPFTKRDGFGSSSVIVPTPVPSTMAAFAELNRRTINDSEIPSCRVSPRTTTWTVPLVPPMGIVTVPLVAV